MSLALSLWLRFSARTLRAGDECWRERTQINKTEEGIMRPGRRWETFWKQAQEEKTVI